MARIVLLLAILTAAGFYWWQRNGNGETHAEPSAVSPLALGAAAQTDRVDIRINPPAELDRRSKAEVLGLRERAVAAYPELLAADYVPSTAVFGQMVDGAYWWGIPGQFRRGPGPDSIEGPSEESRFILNPYLLVAPEFNDWWPDLSDAEAVDFPYVCYPKKLVWMPKEAKAEVTYAAECIAQRQRREFDLIAYNARDLGLRYIYVSYAALSNISKAAPPADAYDNPQYIHRGGSCGFRGGCNNMSPQTPPIEGLRIDGLPAKVAIKLWRNKPDSVNRRLT